MVIEVDEEVRDGDEETVIVVEEIIVLESSTITSSTTITLYHLPLGW